MKKIMILNGSPRKNGKTASLVKAFTEGAESVGNEVEEFYIDGMNIASCKACEACSRNGGHCPQKDDMEKVNEAYIWADVIVFASPMYWGTISGQLKTAVDRLKWLAPLDTKSVFEGESAVSYAASCAAIPE